MTDEAPVMNLEPGRHKLILRHPLPKLDAVRTNFLSLEWKQRKGAVSFLFEEKIK